MGAASRTRGGEEDPSEGFVGVGPHWVSGSGVSTSDFEAVSLHGSTVDRLIGAGSLRGVTIGSDQLVPLAVPILAARRILVDDDPPDLVEGG